MPDITIAVDGFSATGKSTFAKLVAKDFGFLYLDSGAMYRAVTLFAQENGMIDADANIDLEALKKALDKGLDIHFEHTEDGCKTFIGDRCVEKDIRTMAVSSQVSPVSAVGFVRNFVDDKLHAFSAAGRVIMDGRDIGTTVFPNAEVKIFMTARPEVRAQRRFDELVEKGENPVMEEVMKNLEERDYIDSHREVSPLSRAADAFVMDNSDMTLHEETVWMLGLLQGKFGILE
ncbi:MAG: (d)CMP kinase [Bacteroidales bacterium]|nr:(d)CMP kinase [Bacteroidales bacterium]MBQ6292033.1 (d)CMP kinase [Bacteroidales bacterium]MBR4479332.1 (d)CMP kinase [Bacteroidales bacterium]